MIIYSHEFSFDNYEGGWLTRVTKLQKQIRVRHISLLTSKVFTSYLKDVKIALDEEKIKRYVNTGSIPIKIILLSTTIRE